MIDLCSYSEPPSCAPCSGPFVPWVPGPRSPGPASPIPAAWAWIRAQCMTKSTYSAGAVVQGPPRLQLQPAAKARAVQLAFYYLYDPLTFSKDDIYSLWPPVSQLFFFHHHITDGGSI